MIHRRLAPLRGLLTACGRPSSSYSFGRVHPGVSGVLNGHQPWSFRCRSRASTSPERSRMGGQSLLAFGWAGRPIRDVEEPGACSEHGISGRTWEGCASCAPIGLFVRPGRTRYPMGARKSMGAHRPFLCAHEDFALCAQPKIVSGSENRVRIRRARARLFRVSRCPKSTPEESRAEAPGAHSKRRWAPMGCRMGPGRI
jgi:hypothetical protein